jgi:pyrimidine-nucleoside phosphorylase
LSGNGPEDLHEEVVRLAAELLHLADDVPLETGQERARQAISSGRALEKFHQWVDAQGGQTGWTAQGLPLAPVRREWHVKGAQGVSGIDARLIGQAALELGAGRHRIDDGVDPAVGILCFAKIGQELGPDQPAAVVYAQSESLAEQALATIQKAVRFGGASSPPPLIYDRIGDGAAAI